DLSPTVPGEAREPLPTLTAPFSLSTARVPIFQPPADVLPFAREAGPSQMATTRAKAGDAPTRPRTDTVMAIGGKAPAAGPSWLQKQSASPSAPPPPATPRF